ncbi:GCN5-related N-acetyltransferase 1, chloroplastic isoform X2 [Physcomitrium patens]|uniref:N-acetyltransferase domain-containing protein n=1 Tax=Physcomitrium patens TaxID=3218 RepID=A0A7I4EFB3_PHYPA|nr:serotonin N-acetyltransferase 2, chloroplastic-like isoform X2 [Physcomitrium patens]|eukprot:XP_024382330.1 serotonin N-acetyltransferase 2, chloroplastic-like isoform X2 [Physcomitrella patens]
MPNPVYLVGCSSSFQAPIPPQAVYARSPGWEVRTHGYRSNNRMSFMAVAPSQSEAAGVTESGKFSQTDEDLESAGFTCHSTIEDLDLDQLNALFSKVSFPQRDKGKLLRALENTQSLVWIQEIKTSRLIGFARATGDRVFHAIIWDVVVDPAYQGLGLGKVLMERLMADLMKMGISNIALYAEPTVIGFYQPMGFIADPDGIRAMAYSRRR